MSEETPGWTQFADLLLSPPGGALLGWLWWTAMPKRTPVEGLNFQCVDVLGSSICNPWAASGIGAFIAFVIALGIHTVRS
jgi:hypothetical protein